MLTGRETFAATAADAPAGARVPVAVRVAVDDPFTAYRRARQAVGGAYLATTGGQGGWGYFGVAPTDWLRVEPTDGDALVALEERLADEALVRGDCAVPYPAGAIGWLSYDLVREIETVPDSAERDRDLPWLQVAVYDTLASWTEPRGGESTALTVTSCPRMDGGTAGAGDAANVAGAEIEAASERGRERALALAEAVLSGDPAVVSPPVDRGGAIFESECGRAAFADRVRTVKEHVRAGETFQANVSQRLVAPAAVHPVEAFDALRTVNPAPYSAFLEFPGVDLVSASPELLLDREGRTVRTEPIAGTRPRGATPAEDETLERDLRTDEKERAEHAMLVDLERNDLGKVCAFGTVDVDEYRRVDRYSEVMHLVSDVTGRLRDDVDLADLLAAVFPGGTVTGAPKPRTMATIDQVEATRRGPYTGSIGLFGFDDRATCNIVIRTLVRYEDEYHLRVGAGVVDYSVPEREYAETLDKARALVTAVDRALGDRGDLAVDGPISSD